MASVKGIMVVGMVATAAVMVATGADTAGITVVTTVVITITASEISDDSFQSETLGGLFLPSVPVAEHKVQSRLKFRHFGTFAALFPFTSDSL